MYEPTSPDTPAQNGISKRLNRYVIKRLIIIIIVLTAYAYCMRNLYTT